MTPAEACCRAKVGQDAVHNLLRGETHSLNLATLEPLAVVLEVTVSELIGDPMLSFPGSHTDVTSRLQFQNSTQKRVRELRLAATLV